jgi:hypothetical protein
MLNRYLSDIQVIKNEISILKTKWEIFLEIKYGGKNIDEWRSAYEVAPYFFQYTRSSLFDNVILAITRLYEPGSDNYNITKLLNKLEFDFKEPVELTTLIKKHVETRNQIIQRLPKYKTLRDKYIAHLDKEAINDKSAILNEFKTTIDEIEMIIENSFEIVDSITITIDSSFEISHPRNIMIELDKLRKKLIE